MTRHWTGAANPLQRVMGIRSWLFTPSQNERKLRGALRSDADAVIADLEDSVPKQEKDLARETLARVFKDSSGNCVRAVRIGVLGTPEADRDLELLETLEDTLVVVPKADPSSLVDLPSSLTIIAIIETAVALKHIDELAAAEAVTALMLGPADLSANLGLETRDDGLELLHARSELVLNSAIAGIAPPIDGPRLQFRNQDGLYKELELIRSLGFGAKACIHPDQVTIVNQGLTPSHGEVEWAKRTITKLGAAQQVGEGAVAVDGMMVDEPVVNRARAILTRVSMLGE